MKYININALMRFRKYAIATLMCVFFIPTHAGDTKTEFQYLSGKGYQDTKTWDFFCTGGRNSGVWTTIEVPSHWEQQGFGNYDYGRDYMTYGKDFRFADEKGLYKYTFNVPADWKNRDVNIVFEGSMTDTEVKINGKSAGPIHQGSFYRFKYDISDLLNYGADNLLEVTVSKMSSNKSVNRAERYADYWIFGGIYRPVYLESAPKEHVDYVAVNAKADGNFAMDVFTKGLTKKRTIKAIITDYDGNEYAVLKGKISTDDSKTTLTGNVKNIKPWTQETPAIYLVNIELLDGKTVLHKTTDKFGFRTIEIRKEDGIYINGTRIKMKGINRHAFWPESGRCLNDELNLKDVKMLKDLNLNAVRCSHYPPDKVFLDYCDSLGLYVIDELAGWQNAYDTKSGEILVEEMVKRDLNHPSVIFWSNGNEGGHNFDLDDDYGKWDLSNRPVIHAHHKPGNDFNGIDCNHYEDYYSCKNILKGPNIYMPTEFLHGQDDGGMAASLYDFWELFWNEKLSGGGFLWTFVDEGISRTDLNGYIDVNRVNAPDGIVGPHREKEGSYPAMKEIFSPIKISMKTLPDDFNGTIPVENRYHFTNLDKCTFNWKLVDFNKPANRRYGYETKYASTATSPDVAPVKSGSLQLDLPSDWKSYDGLLLEAIDPAGNKVLDWSWMIKSNDDIRKLLVTWENGSVDVTEDDETISLHGGEVTLILKKSEGTIQALRNDRSLPLSFKNGPVSVSDVPQTLKEMKQYKSDDGYSVEFLFDGDLKMIKWTMNPTGWVSLDYEYMQEGKQSFTGVSFDYPESRIIGVKWLGHGPYRVWKNRLQGGNYDVYEAFYNNTYTGSSPWDYPEFKGYFSNIAWMDFNTVEGHFLVVAEQKDLFVRLFDFCSLSAPETLPRLPKGDISFLDGIPPTGTKLWINISMNTERLGPSGELNVMQKPVKRKLYFYFGLPQ
ncbi:glycoside hydrolase family 2 protein [Saccharicrinis sp. FJH62]|uniref:glycoside hydrolase family 2 protein n=1 Tax=Saccharicrinis sp. FJH62 TaxID=3344657 RepID=UPI0035D4173F